MPSCSWFARWFAWLVAPQGADTRRPSAQPYGERPPAMTRTNPPTYIAYHVPASTAGAQGEARAGWTRVGAAWLHPDGLGFDVVLDVLPLDGRFTLCAPLAETGTLGRGSVRRGDVWYPGDTPPQVPCGEEAGDDGSQR